MASRNLEPELKEIADKVYFSDTVKFKKLIVWIEQGRKFGALESDMAETLRQFWDYRFIDEWYPYLDSILEKVRADRNMRASDSEHGALKASELKRGEGFLTLVKGVGDVKKAD